MNWQCSLLAFCNICIFVYCKAADAEVKFTEEELKQRLTALQYHVTQEKGTER